MELINLLDKFIEDVKTEQNKRIIEHLTNNPSADVDSFLKTDKDIKGFVNLSNLLINYKSEYSKNGYTAPVKAVEIPVIENPILKPAEDKPIEDIVLVSEPVTEEISVSDIVSETEPTEELVTPPKREISEIPDSITCTISRFKADKDDITVYVYPLSTRKEGKNAKILVEIYWKNRYHGFSSYDSREDGNTIVQARIGEYLLNISAFYDNSGTLKVNVVPMEGLLIPVSTDVHFVDKIITHEYNSVYGNGRIVAIKSTEDENEYATAVFNNEFCDYNHLTKAKPFAWIVEEDNRIKYEVADSEIILE